MAANLSVTLKLIDQISSKLESIASGGDKVANNIEKFGSFADDAFNRATSGAEKVNSSMNQVSTSVENYVDKGNQAQQMLENQATSADKAAQEIDKVGNEAEEAGDQAHNFGEKGANAAISLGDALAAAGIVTALKEIAEAYNEADEAADEFEESMAKVSTIADTHAESLADIQGEIQQLSKDTGKNVNDISEAVYGAISASVDTAEAVGFVAQANALAVGGFTQIETSVDVLTTALNAYNLEATETERIANVLIMTQNLGKTTVDELASSMGMVIPTAAAYNVSIEQLAASYAIMTANGINTANATTNINRMLAELADTGSDVAEVLMEETGKGFADLMAEGKTLGDVMEILGDSVNHNATAFSNLWGSAVAGRGALTLMNSGAEKFASSLDAMENSAGAADEAFAKMTDTGAYVEQKFENAMDNFQISIGNAQPQMDKLMIFGTEVLNKMASFVDKNPNVVKAIEATVAAVAAFTAAMTLYTVGSKAAEMATLALTAAMDTNPIFLVVSAVAALTVGLGIFIATAEDVEYEDTRLIARSEELSLSIDRQRDEVERLATEYGEHSEEVTKAEAKLGELEAEYEASAVTMGQFKKMVEETSNAVSESTQSYDEAISALDEQFHHTDVLIAELQALQTQTELTAFQQEYQKQIVDQLNTALPSLGLSIDENTGKTNKGTSALKAYCEQKLEQMKLEQRAQTYMEYMQSWEEYQEELRIAQENLTAATEEYEAAVENVGDAVVTVGGNDIMSASIEITNNAVREAQANVDDLTSKIEELEGQMNALESEADGAASGVDGVSESLETATLSADELADELYRVFTDSTDAMKDYIEAYNDALDGNRDKVSGMIGLFGEVKTAAGTAFNDIGGLWDKQIQYLEEYNANLEKAREYGLADGLLANLADGSAESAATLGNIVAEIDKVTEKGEDVQKFVDDFNAKFEELGTAQEQLAETMTSLDTELKDKLALLQSDMEKGIDELNLDDEAKKAAEETMSAYVDALSEYGTKAIAEAESIAKKVSSALSASVGSGKSSGKVNGHAEGTTYGENVYLAGEYGPELIVGRQGSEVFPASETAKILQAVMSNKENDREMMAPSVQAVGMQVVTTNENTTNTQNRNISLTINGKGSLGIPGGVSMSQVKEFISTELEGAIMGILAKEIYEEGAVAYDF